MDSTNSVYDEGKAHLRAKEFAEAAAAFLKLVTANPNDAEAWQFLGAARSQLREWPTAVNAFRKAEALEPTVRNRYNLAVALKEGLGRNDEARLYLERALEQDPGHAPSKELLGELVAMTSAAAFDSRQVQAQVAVLERQGAALPAGRKALGIVVAVVAALVACGIWVNLPIGGPLVALCSGWLVGILTAKACGQGGRTAAQIAGWVAGIFFLPLCILFIVGDLSSKDVLGVLFNIIAIPVGISQAYRIALTTE